jgi:hypothetical protein
MSDKYPSNIFSFVPDKLGAGKGKETVAGIPLGARLAPQSGVCAYRQPGTPSGAMVVAVSKVMVWAWVGAWTHEGLVVYLECGVGH